MPDQIENKGAALCMMGAYCFERLEEQSVRTHYKGLVDSDGSAVGFREVRQPSSVMEVCIVNVYRPEPRFEGGRLTYDYSAYTPNLRNTIIPLEIIYRNGLPEGSSVFKRLEQGKITFQDLGLDHYPKTGEHFAKPIFDVSTKLEQTDRYLTWDEAKTIAGLTNIEMIAVKAVLAKVNDTITEMACRAHMSNEDGKIELAFDQNRTLMVVDVVGTLDESRFTCDSFHVSKEIARQFYKRTIWYKDVEDAKREAEAKGIKDWKSLCKSQPPKLAPALKRFISEMYMAAANELTNRRIFDVPALAKIIDQYRQSSDKT
jgi:phosphoribosylaminoimidazole-succinocarboxamide synthase